MQCSLLFVLLKNWTAVKLSIYLPSDFLFSFSGPSFLPCLLTFHSVSPFLEASQLATLPFKTNSGSRRLFACLRPASLVTPTPTPLFWDRVLLCNLGFKNPVILPQPFKHVPTYKISLLMLCLWNTFKNSEICFKFYTQVGGCWDKP